MGIGSLLSPAVRHLGLEPPFEAPADLETADAEVSAPGAAMEPSRA